MHTGVKACVKNKSSTHLLCRGEIIQKYGCGSTTTKRLNSGKEKSEVIEELRRDFDLAVLLNCTSMARSSFYYYQKHFRMQDKYAEVKELIKHIYHTIDKYPIESLNLAKIEEGNKLISINGKIRKAIQKKGGDSVTVSLYLLQQKKQWTKEDIIESFREIVNN